MSPRRNVPQAEESAPFCPTVLFGEGASVQLRQKRCTTTDMVENRRSSYDSSKSVIRRSQRDNEVPRSITQVKDNTTTADKQHQAGWTRPITLQDRREIARKESKAQNGKAFKAWMDKKKMKKTRTNKMMEESNNSKNTLLGPNATVTTTDSKQNNKARNIRSEQQPSTSSAALRNTIRNRNRNRARSVDALSEKPRRSILLPTRSAINSGCISSPDDSTNGPQLRPKKDFRFANDLVSSVSMISLHSLPEGSNRRRQQQQQQQRSRSNSRSSPSIANTATASLRRFGSADNVQELHVVGGDEFGSLDLVLDADTIENESESQRQSQRQSCSSSLASSPVPVDVRHHLQKWRTEPCLAKVTMSNFRQTQSEGSCIHTIQGAQEPLVDPAMAVMQRLRKIEESNKDTNKNPSRHALPELVDLKRSFRKSHGDLVALLSTGSKH